MRVKSKVHQIKITFHVTPQIERFVYVYLITGRSCYLIDTGVDGTEKVIADYLKNIGRDIGELSAILLTHSHPDHIGAAYELKKLTGCRIYASAGEKEWIEDIEKQFRERPIPNFKGLVNKSVPVDEVVKEGTILKLEEGITLQVIETGGHSKDSISFYYPEENIVFTGDAIPVVGDIPIYINAGQSKNALHKIRQLEEIDYYCPAWDSIYMGREGKEVIDRALKQFDRTDQCIREVRAKHPDYNEEELFGSVCDKLNMIFFTHNPLFKTSIISSINELLSNMGGAL